MERKNRMNRKLANDPNAVANKSAALKLPVRVDVAEQPLRECDPLGATRSPAEDSPTAEMPVAVSREWIAWWLNLSLDSKSVGLCSGKQAHGCEIQ
jgi:hypothetical protein